MKNLIMIALLFPVFATAWTRFVDNDKMSDQKYVQFSQASEQPVFGKKTAMLSVMINCKTEEKKLLLVHPWVLGKRPVKLRLDKEESFALYANTGNTAKILIIGDPTSQDPTRNPEGTIQRMTKHKKMLVRYEEAGGKIVDAEFNIGGLEKSLKNPCK